MRHDATLRAAARAIYDSVFAGEKMTEIPFEQAERFGTAKYRQAVGAAQRARAQFADETACQLAMAL